MNVAPVQREVALVGGGHTHALLIRAWGMDPLPGVRLTLVSENVLTPYSGMLPGLVAGHYTADEIHVDLRRLCTWAGVRFVEARMTGLDLQARTLALEGGRPPLGFDLLCLDTGSTPDLSVPGARERSVPVKPVHGFAARWHALAARLERGDVPDAPLEVAVVGSGAGGFEIAMAMRHALPREGCTLHWVLRGATPLTGRPGRVGRMALDAAREAGVRVHVGFDVERVDEGPALVARDGRTLALDELVWCTGATGPAWPARAGFATDDRGFVLTDACLRSVSHPFAFAVGDVGTLADGPTPKAGVFAVRQAPALGRNLRRALLGEPLVPWRPQRNFLTLMATGPKAGIASRGPFAVRGEWVWRWKDRIDRRFMDRLAELPAMPARTLPPIAADALLDTDPAAPDATTAGGGLRCRGCGAKVGGDLLAEVLGRTARRAGAQPAKGVLVGLAEARDAAVLDVGDALVVQSVDQLSAIVDDPWLFGRIAAVHALGDVLTLEAEPHTAQLLVTLPPAAPRVQARELERLVAGAVGALDEHGVALVGGHTAEGPELSLGLVVDALAPRASIGRTTGGAAGARAGDALVLSAPLGVGTVFAGLMRGLARGPDVSRALSMMARGQADAAATLREHGARALTDVTGFGLVGHLERLLDGASVRAALDVDALPLLPGALALARAGVRSSAWPNNRRSLERFAGAEAIEPALRSLLADPQTAGALLAVLPAERAADAMAALREGRTGGDARVRTGGAVRDATSEAAIVGTLVEAQAHRVGRGTQAVRAIDARRAA